MLAGDSCTVSGLSAPSGGALDTACVDGATLADGASCTLTCNSGYTSSGTQPSCSAGTFSAGSVACSGEPEPQTQKPLRLQCRLISLPGACKGCQMRAGDSCTVSGLSAPSNGALDSACADGATLADGASCTLTCNSGYTLSGAQPSCSAGTFSDGGVTCSGEPEPQTQKAPAPAVPPHLSAWSMQRMSNACRQLVHCRWALYTKQWRAR